MKPKKMRKLSDSSDSVNTNLNEMSNTQLANYYLKYIKEYKSPNTLEVYSHNIKSFIEFIDDKPLKDIERKHLSKWLDEKARLNEKPLKKTTRKVCLTVISSFYKHLSDEGFDISINPGLSALKINGKATPEKYEPLSLEEVRTIIKTATSPREKCLIGILALTGARIR
jgi:site-specific recombinase XerD